MSVPPSYERIPVEIRTDRKPRDLGFAAAFLFNVAVLAPFALSGGARNVTSLISHYVSGATAGVPIDPGNPVFVGVVCVAPAVALALCALWLHVLRNHGAWLLKWTLLGAVIFNAVAGVALLIAFASYGGIGMLFVAAMTYWYYLWVRPHIAFAAASLKVSQAALSAATPTIYGTAFLLAASQVIWIAYWAIGAAGLLLWLSDNAIPLSNESPQYSQPTAPQSPNYGGTWSPSTSSDYYRDPQTFQMLLNVGYFYVVLLLLWGCQVVRGITHCTVAGVVGDWWFRPNADVGVTDSLKRAATMSLGSVCFGALIVSAVQAVKWVMERARRREQVDTAANALRHTGAGRVADVLSFPGNCGGSSQFIQCANALGACLLQLLSQALEYCSIYAYSFVAIYGHDFKTAGRLTLDIFRQRGWSAVINDRLLSRLLFAGLVVISAVTAFITALFLQSQGVGTAPTAIAAGAASAITLFIGGVVLSVIEGAVATVFVCFAQDAQALSVSHPNQFAALVAAWQEAHPHEVKDCGLLTSPFALMFLANGSSV